MPSRALIVRGLTLAMLSMLVPSAAHAQGKLRGVARLGAEFGGDEVLQFRYSDGTTPDVTAGSGLLLTGGGQLSILPRLDLQVTAGIKYRTIPPATNQSASWLRFPVEASVGVSTPFGLRVRGGPVVHLANTLKADGGAANMRVEFETKPGVFGQIEYVFRGGVSLDLRYTALRYSVVGSGATVNGNSIGGGCSYYFGKR